MEIINFPWDSSTGITGFVENQINQLNTYDNGHFFSRYEADGQDIKCYLGDNVALTIKQQTTYTPAQIIGNDFSFACQSNSYQGVKTAIIHDKGICLFFNQLNTSSYGYGCPLLITKKKNNELAILWFDNSSPSAPTYITSPSIWTSSTANTTDYIVVTIKDDSSATVGKMTIGFMNAKYFNPEQTTKIYGFQAFDPTDGVLLDDIFICTVCGIRNLEPSYIKVNEIDYTGVCSNTILLKGK